MASKVRLDVELVSRGLARSREEAQRFILAGEVRIGDRVARKASEAVRPGAVLAVDDKPRFVGRGGDKLTGALDAFGLDVAGRIAVDVGASTGGFTDCLLSRGARRVYAIDVGYGQLDWGLRRDPRVVVIERQNIRELSADAIPERVGLAVVDVSFISLSLVLPTVSRLLAPGSDVVALVKPQFEVGKGKVGKGGVVRNSVLQLEAVDAVRAAASRLEFAERGCVESPLRGSRGNREFFLHWMASR